MAEGWNENHFTLYVRIRAALDIIFRKRPDLRKQFAGDLESKQGWEESLAGRMALHLLAAREYFVKHTGYGRPGAPNLTRELADSEVYKILMNQGSLFDDINPRIRAVWNPFRPLYAELRHLDAQQDPAIKAKLRMARKLANKRRKESAVHRAREKQKLRARQLPLFKH